MEAMETPRIGHKDDAVDLLDRLIEIAKANIETGKVLVLGLEALRDVIDREAI